MDAVCSVVKSITPRHTNCELIVNILTHIVQHDEASGALTVTGCTVSSAVQVSVVGHHKLGYNPNGCSTNPLAEQ